MIAPLGQQASPADPWVSIRAQADRLSELEADIARDPEGHFWRTGAFDRRIPPWHSTTVPPQSVSDRLSRMLRGVGQDPEHFSVVYAWFTDTFDFVRWMPSIDVVSHRIGQLVYVPVELDSLPAAYGWQSVEDAAMTIWRGGFRSVNNDEARRMRAKFRERQDAERVIQQLSLLVSTAEATPEQREQYEAALALRDGSAGDEWLEHAKDARPIFKRLAEEAGI